jgi:hypothetical protein
MRRRPKPADAYLGLPHPAPFPLDVSHVPRALLLTCLDGPVSYHRRSLDLHLRSFFRRGSARWFPIRCPHDVASSRGEVSLTMVIRARLRRLRRDVSAFSPRPGGPRALIGSGGRPRGPTRIGRRRCLVQARGPNTDGRLPRVSKSFDMSSNRLSRRLRRLFHCRDKPARGGLAGAPRGARAVESVAIGDATGSELPAAPGPIPSSHGHDELRQRVGSSPRRDCRSPPHSLVPGRRHIAEQAL